MDSRRTKGAHDMNPGDVPEHLPGCGPDCYRCAFDASPQAEVAALRRQLAIAVEALEALKVNLRSHDCRGAERMRGIVVDALAALKKERP